MRVASITWFTAFAVVALLIGGASATAVAATVNVIPLPNKVEIRSGVFTIRSDTPLSAFPDARAVRVADYFADLMQKTHALKLSAPVASRRSAAGVSKLDAPHVIVFRLERPRGGISREAYVLDVTPERIIVSAGDARGLVYGGGALGPGWRP